MKPDIMSPEQVAAMEAEERKQMEENRVWLIEMAQRLGFSVTKLEKNEEGYAVLPDNDKDRNLTWTKGWGGLNRDTYFLQAARPDGKVIRANVVLHPTTSTFAFPVDIESEVFFERHSGNHDMSRSELEGSLRNAFEGKKYQPPLKK